MMSSLFSCFPVSITILLQENIEYKHKLWSIKWLMKCWNKKMQSLQWQKRSDLICLFVHYRYLEIRQNIMLSFRYLLYPLFRFNGKDDNKILTKHWSLQGKVIFYIADVISNNHVLSYFTLAHKLKTLQEICLICELLQATLQPSTGHFRTKIKDITPKTPFSASYLQLMPKVRRFC